MYQRHKDTLLLEDAYNASRLTQHLPNMTLEQVKLVIENASPAELEVLEELFGGIKNLARGAKEGVQKAGRAAKEKVQQGARAVGQAARDAGDIAKGGVEAVKAGAQQVGSNVKGMYNAGEDKAAAEKRKSQLINHVAQLEELFAGHIEASPSSNLAKTKLDSITIGQLKRALGATASTKTKAAADARAGGFLGGVGAAAQKGYEKSRADQKAAEGAQPGGAPAPAPA